MTDLPEPQQQDEHALSGVQQTMLIPLVARALVGGLFPALRAARLPITTALRET